MQHDNELFDDYVQLESLAASLSPFDNDLNPDLVTLDPSFEVTNHDFRDNRAFTIDLLFFRCLRFSNKIQPSPQLIAEIPFWDISTKLPLVTINMYPVRPFSTRSLTSTQDTTANNDEIICAENNQLGLHPIMYAASSSSSLDPLLLCPDLLPMICCRLLLHSIQMSR